MTVCLNLDKEDIKTSIVGNNYVLQTGNLFITFTPSAIEEFLNDLAELKSNELHLQAKT